ncbi:YbaK/EbsC family protein [Lysobacter sp. CCNWLW3]|uniref:aminoacyl-tRNA deacylase n=1 Tax=unclassified Lysobacter TaxID=2635362 RepID=UPI002FD1BD14
MASQRLQDYLHSHQVAYDTLAHPYAMTAHGAAVSADIDDHEMAKTVMVKLDGRLAMAVVPADEWLRLTRLREASGAQYVALASEAEFKERFPECEVGAMPPFGNLYGLEVYAADSLAGEERIAFNAGSHRELMRIAWSDFEQLVHPRVAALTRH